MKQQLCDMEKIHSGIAASVVLGSLFFKQSLLTFSIVLGFALTRLNFVLLKKIVFLLLSSRQKNRGGFKIKLLGLLVGKYFLSILLLGGVIVYFDLHIVGLLIGISTLVLAIALSAGRVVFEV